MLFPKAAYGVTVGATMSKPVDRDAVAVTHSNRSRRG